MNCKTDIASIGECAKKGNLQSCYDVLMMGFVSKRLKQIYSLIMQ